MGQALNTTAIEKLYALALSAYLLRDNLRFSQLLARIPSENVEHSLLKFRSSFFKWDPQLSLSFLKKIHFQLSHQKRSDKHQMRLLADYHFLKARFSYLSEQSSRKDFLQAETFYKLCQDHESALSAAISSLLELRESGRKEDHDASLARIKKTYGELHLESAQLLHLHRYEIQYHFDNRSFDKIVALDSLTRFPEGEARASVLNMLYICAAHIEESRLEEAQCLIDTLNASSILDEDLLETTRFLMHLQKAKAHKQPVRKSWIKSLLAEPFREYSERVAS